MLQKCLCFQQHNTRKKKQMEKACDLCHITLNKNAVVGDVSAMTPGGVRIGTPAMTSRGLKEVDFERIAELLHQVMLLCKQVQAGSGKMLKAFETYGFLSHYLMMLCVHITSIPVRWRDTHVWQRFVLMQRLLQRRFPCPGLPCRPRPRKPTATPTATPTAHTKSTMP